MKRRSRRSTRSKRWLLGLLAAGLGAAAAVAQTFVESTQVRPGPPDRLLASYHPPELPPGTYHLQVTLTDGSGVSRTSSTSFVIGV